MFAGITDQVNLDDIQYTAARTGGRGVNDNITPCIMMIFPDGQYVCLYVLIFLFEYIGLSQQTQNICITFVQRRHKVFDVGPTLYKC